MFKLFAPFLAGPIASIFNESKQQYTVPLRWRKADIIPSLKTANLNDIAKHLRPIPFTQTLSKVCERFVAEWVLESIRDLIDIRQFGSLSNSSTSHAFFVIYSVKLINLGKQ